jgi:hypothetical protein
MVSNPMTNNKERCMNMYDTHDVIVVEGACDAMG